MDAYNEVLDKVDAMHQPDNLALALDALRDARIGREVLASDLAAARAEVARLREVVEMVASARPTTEPELGSARVVFADQENYKAAYNLWLIGQDAFAALKGETK